MDVLKPPLLRIGNRCYRKNVIKDREHVNLAEEDMEEEGRDTAYSQWNDEICDLNFDIEETETGFRATIDVPSVYYKFIIGKRGEVKSRLENETRTLIRIPRQGKEGEIVIVGHDKKGVHSAKSRIDMLIDAARQKQPFTHFISFPLNMRTIRENYEDFKIDVLRECDGDRGLDPSIFQNPAKLHMTLGTLALLNEAEIARAVDILKQCQSELVDPILRGVPMVGEFRGLEYMNDDPMNVDVLYGKVQLTDQSDRLQMLSDRIVDRFVSQGLMQRDYDRVKLHVTLINTLMRKDPSGALLPRPNNRNDTERESFDASSILKKFSDYDFGEVNLCTIHLSTRFSTGPDGYYTCAGMVRLPS